MTANLQDCDAGWNKNGFRRCSTALRLTPNGQDVILDN